MYRRNEHNARRALGLPTEPDPGKPLRPLPPKVVAAIERAEHYQSKQFGRVGELRYDTLAVLLACVTDPAGPEPKTGRKAEAQEDPVH